MTEATSFRLVFQDEAGTALGRVHAAGFVEHRGAVIPQSPRLCDGYLLSFIHAGAGAYRDAEIPTRPIGPGDAIVVGQQRPFWYAPPPDGGWSEIFVFFDGPVFDALAAGGVLDVSDPVRRLVPLDAWRERLREFVSRLRLGRVAERELEVLELAGLLVELRRDSEPAEPLPRPIRLARELLAADLTAELDLRDVAARVGLPYDTFRKRFRAGVGVSPGAFRLDRRIDAAKSLLRMTPMTHAAIATSLGFANEQHFAKRFRARAGRSPRAYRSANPAR